MLQNYIANDGFNFISSGKKDMIKVGRKRKKMLQVFTMGTCCCGSAFGGSG